MTSGGFETGSDYVAAKVSIDVPTEGIQNLKEASQQLDRFRTAAESAARSSDSFTAKLQGMLAAATQATEAHRQLTQQLSSSADASQRLQTGGESGQLTSSRNAPQGFVDSFSGMGAGMGGQRGPNASDVQNHIIDPTRQLDPRKYINAQAGRNRVQNLDLPVGAPGAADWAGHAERIEQRDQQQRQQEERTPGGSNAPRSAGGGGESLGNRVSRYSGLANNLMNEMQPGGGKMGLLGAAHKGLQALSRPSAAAGPGASGTSTAVDALGEGGAAGAEEAASGGLAGLAGMAGGAAAGLGIGMAGMAAVQKGGAIYQGYKNLGNIKGGGAAEGMGTEAQIRGLALNPFLSTDQSRQIIMAGLTEGYSGKQFDTVTQFMASNLKDMNISVSDSVQMLRKNVNEGGASITGLATSLGALKDLSKNGVMSQPDLDAAFMQGTGQLISGGSSGGSANSNITAALGTWSDDHNLAGNFAGMVASAGSNNPAAGALLRSYGGAQTPAGLNPAMTGAYLSEHGGPNALGLATGQTLKSMVSRIFGNAPAGSVQFLNSIPVFQKMLATLDPNNPAISDTDKAIELVQKVRGGGNPMQEGVDKQNARASTVGAAPNVTGGQILGAGVRAVGDVFKGLAGWVTGNETADNNARDDATKTLSNIAYNQTASASNPVLDSVINQNGASNVQVVDAQGNGSPLTGGRDQISQLASGKLSLRPKGDTGKGVPLSQVGANGSLPSAGGNNTQVSFSPASVNIKIDQTTGQATVSPNPVRLTPNQQAANSGVAGASMNNPPAGDGYGYYQGRSVGSH